MAYKSTAGDAGAGADRSSRPDEAGRAPADWAPPPPWPGGGPPQPYGAGPYAPGAFTEPGSSGGPYGPPPPPPYGSLGGSAYGAQGTPTYGPAPGQEVGVGDPTNRYGWPYVPPPPPTIPRSAEDRRRRRRRGLTFAAALVLAVGAGIGIGAAVAPTNPTTVARALLHKAMSAAAAATSYHYVELSTLLGAPDNIEGDALQHGGRQVIRQRCGSNTDLFQLRLVNGIVYFRGNAPSVSDQLGVAGTRASTLADRWVKVTKGDSVYNTFADGITTRSNVSQLPTVIVPRSTRAVSGSSPAKTEIVGALNAGKGKAVGTADLVLVTSTSLPLTLRGSAVGTQGSTFAVKWTFSSYGEKVTVDAPSGAIDYSSLHAKAPSKNACG
jgi:hypothetical protein